ncbi:MAG: DUF3301 domain-containing protein [Rhodocyclaceae bacterium]|nr:DUF3301 domain-containing protein [Rhodocyclaceae bacterium]
MQRLADINVIHVRRFTQHADRCSHAVFLGSIGDHFFRQFPAGRERQKGLAVPLFELISIALLSALLWFWYDSARVREIAIRVAQRACQAEGVQLLDETVAVSRTRPARDDEGRLVLQRIYRFEYSETGDNRRPGSLVMLGPAVVAVNIGLRLVGE